MSFSDSAASATAFDRALTTLVIGAIAASAVIIAPLANSNRADAIASQPARTDIVAAGSATPESHVVGSASRWAARPSILVVSTVTAPAGQSAAPATPVAAVASLVARTPQAATLGDFISQRDVRIEAIARALARLKAQHEAEAAAAAAAAAAQAAAAAAAQAAAQEAAQAAANAAARAAQGFVQRVWTSGFQNEINQCRGAVDVTAVYQVRVIAEHSNCGGSRFPTGAGAIVTITGLDAGRYRVIGVVAHLNGEVDHAEDIPRGYDLLFQTCASGFTDMRFTALERIG